MKGNINKTDGSGHWWAYDAFCDDCGKQFRDNNVMSSEYPDLSDPDYCLPCLRKRIDKIIHNMSK